MVNQLFKQLLYVLFFFIEEVNVVFLLLLRELECNMEVGYCFYNVVVDYICKWVGIYFYIDIMVGKIVEYFNFNKDYIFKMVK